LGEAILRTIDDPANPPTATPLPVELIVRESSR
jgi:DNA-binding LacI/PurR family transcriptional regulator